MFVKIKANNIKDVHLNELFCTLSLCKNINWRIDIQYKMQRVGYYTVVHMCIRLE